MTTTSPSVHFSSQTIHWRTPAGLYDELDREFGFDFDPCPPEPDFDGLMIEWGERNFVNPPYGKAIESWMRKASEQARLGKLVVALVPSRTDTSWWHDYAMTANEIRFLRGRIQFKARTPERGKGGGRGGLGAAPFPSAVLVWRGEA